MLSPKATSLKIYITRYLLVIFVVVATSAGLSYLVYRHDYVKLQQQEHHKNLLHAATSISRLIQFYQGVVDTIARQHVVIDLLQFGSSEEALQWAKDMQKLVPDSIGMALFEPDGNVRGLLSELRLSDQCLNDMQSRIHDLDVPMPPVHRKIEELAHFDVVAPVIAGNETIGLVFASFSLKSIENLLNESLGEQQLLKVIAPDGYIVASAGKLDSDEGVLIDRFDIKGTDWVLQTSFVSTPGSAVVTALSINNIVIFLLLTVMFVIAMSRFFRIVIADFEIISDMMRHIQDGSFERQRIDHAHLKETEGVITYLRYLATELALHQKKIHDASITDELTGVHNRRVLNQEIDQCMEQARQGESAGLVILDLDNFKQINDRAGHDVGDQILVMLAETLREKCKAEDVCVRVGGDEFILILRGYTRKQIDEWYVSVVNSLQQRAYEFKDKLDNSFRCGISAGYTMIRPEDDRSSLLKRADLALYAAKDKGRCNIQFAR
ncbi:MAG: GGDEF domain-containing protein [Gammaproteobacteria bacterium]|nr:MAG: GGDEF domain-containing protein [Gammaproteobacteria bacterium]